MTWVHSDAPEPRYHVMVLTMLDPEKVIAAGTWHDEDGHFHTLEEAQSYERTMRREGWSHVLIFDCDIEKVVRP